MDLKFRPLREDEVDCRINQVIVNKSRRGCTLLLYKDARCDMNILDETVGPRNWQRSHTRENANCIVSIYDNDKNQWISKEDTGTESYTEKEKGLASDSFKRACVNWGIGRELYTAPFIWISDGDVTLKETERKDKNGNSIYTTYDRFRVDHMVVEDGKIKELDIYNESLHKTVFVFPRLSSKEQAKREKKVAENVLMCPICGGAVLPVKLDDDRVINPQEVFKRFGKCYTCYCKEKSK